MYKRKNSRPLAGRPLAGLTPHTLQRILQICLLTLLVITLTGCSQRATPQPTTPAATQPAQPITEPPPLPPYTVDDPVRAVTRRITLDTYRPERPRFEIMKYTVKEGDTPWSIAQQYDLQIESILWGNETLSAIAASLQIGKVINILPVDGVLHTVVEGETWEKIEVQHGVKQEDIVAFIGNDFPDEPPYDLVVGQKLIIPGGRNPVVWMDPGPLLDPTKGRNSGGFYTGPLVGIGSGTYIWPVSSIRITQPFWGGHVAIDLDTVTGQPIYAADGGTVIFSGTSKVGYGELIIIDHGNGFWTYYAHNSVLYVSVGQGVYQGQQIAESGNTGNSSGDHLHFGIRRDTGGWLDPMPFLPPIP